MNAIIRGVMVTFVCAGTLALTQPVQAAPKAQDVSNINDARGRVHKAIIHMYQAADDFHGHKADAIRDAKAARHQLALCALVDDGNDEAEENAANKTAAGATGARKVKAAKAAKHPQIADAINALNRAIKDLNHADRVYAGHRADALAAAQKAKAQLKVCINQ